MDLKDEKHNDVPGSAVRPGQSGVEGFAPNLGGHAKANHNHTSSFSKDVPTTSSEGKNSQPGQEEGGRTRQPTTSIVGRVDQDKV